MAWEQDLQRQDYENALSARREQLENQVELMREQGATEVQIRRHTTNEVLKMRGELDKQTVTRYEAMLQYKEAMEQAARMRSFQENLNALKLEMAKRAVIHAIAFAASGFTNVVAGLKAAGYAAAAGISAAGARGAGQAAVAAQERAEQIRLAEERRREDIEYIDTQKREAEERAREPGKERGSRETGPRITNSTFNFYFEIINVFHGDIIGYNNFERKLSGSLHAIAMRGKLDWLREIK